MYALSSPNSKLRDRLREFCLADAGRAREKRYTAGAATARGLADTGDGALDDVEHVRDSMRLASDPAPNEFLRAINFRTVDLPPRIVRYADFVAPHGIGDLADRETFTPRELSD